MKDDCDVIVVGAGLSGLAAGATAVAGGARTVVLEAHQPGGRARTIERQGFLFNQGATPSTRAERPWASFAPWADRSWLGRAGRTSHGGQCAWQAALVIHLVRPDLHLMDAALRGDDVLAERLGCDVAAGWATFTEALKPTRDAIAASPDGVAWGARFFVTGDPPELVGWGGFKGPPDDGVVELGYEIAESRRGRGIATAATRAMLAEAFSDEAVTAVIAHTLPERNASNHILEKLGFVFEGEVHEDDEVVWRFRLARSVGE